MTQAPTAAMPQVPSRVTVRVPATSANLGPGYDALGLALDWYDEVTVEVTAGGLQVKVSGDDEQAGTSTGADNLVVQALYATFDRLGDRPAGLAVTSVMSLPHARGLGSSAAAICAGVTAAGALAGGITVEAALQIATDLEGHPDNVAACLLGGLTIAWTTDGMAGARRVPPGRWLRPVVLTPAARTVTAESRQVLPALVPHADAAAGAGRAALLVAVLTAPDADRVALLAATHDTLHQPYRLPGLTATNDVVRRLRAGGIAAVLSGSGPAVLALCTDDAQAEQALASAPAGWRARVAAVDVEGARVLR